MLPSTPVSTSTPLLIINLSWMTPKATSLIPGLQLVYLQLNPILSTPLAEWSKMLMQYFHYLFGSL